MINFCYQHQIFFIFVSFFISINICFIYVYTDFLFYLFILINYMISTRTSFKYIPLKNILIYVSNFDILSQQGFIFIFFIIIYIYSPFIVFLIKQQIKSFFQLNSFIKYWVVYYYFFFIITTTFFFTFFDFGYTAFIDTFIPNEIYQKIIDISTFMFIYKGSYYDFYITYSIVIIIISIILFYPYFYNYNFFKKSLFNLHIVLRNLIYIFIIYFFFSYNSIYNIKIIFISFISIEFFYFFIRFFIILKFFNIKNK